MVKRDLTGQRFGRLTVIRESEDPYMSPAGKKARRWVCRCDCGNVVTVLQNALTSSQNPTRSCGCSRTGSRIKDLSGKRFGRLVVIEAAQLEKPEANGTLTGWRCRCDCGNEIIVPTRRLTDPGKGIKSCGCLLSETARKKVDTDNVLGRFEGTVVSAIQPDRGPNSNNHSGVKGVYWKDREKRWVAKIGFKGKSITIGRFKSLDEAKKAREDAEEKYFSPTINQYNCKEESE